MLLPMLYTIAALINGNEYLVATPNFDMITFRKLQEAKDLFESVYTALKNPSQDNKAFKQSMYRILSTQPSILQLNIPDNKIVAEILSWTNNAPSVTSSLPVIPMLHILIPMKPGFIQRYQVLNILADIEATPYLGENGKINYHHFSLKLKDN